MDFIYVESSAVSPMMFINSFTVNIKKESQISDTSRFSFDKFNKMNKSSQMASFVHTDFDKYKINNILVTPQIHKKEIFTGKMNNNKIKMINIRNNIFITYFQYNNKTNKKELKVIYYDRMCKETKVIKCKYLLVLENSNKGSSKTQYDFNLYNYNHFPRSKTFNSSDTKLVQMFPLQNEIFMLLNINNQSYLFSVDPFLEIIKCHLLSFSSKISTVSFQNIEKYKILISENKLEINDNKNKLDNTYDVSFLANQKLLKNKYSLSGVFVKKYANK